MKDYEKRIRTGGLEILCGVYFLYYKKKLVYVGVSYNIAVRLNQHQNSKKIWDEVRYIIEPDYYKAIVIENYYLDKYNPHFNIAGSKLKYHESNFGENAIYDKKNYPGGWS